MAGWNITIFNRRYMFKQRVHFPASYVSLPECNRTTLTLWVGLCKTTFLFVCVPASPRKGGRLQTSHFWWKQSPGDMSHDMYTCIYIYIGVSYIPGGLLGMSKPSTASLPQGGKDFLIFTSQRFRWTSPPSGVTEFVPDTSVTSGEKIHPLKINGWNMSSWRFGRSFSFQKGCFVGSSR